MRGGGRGDLEWPGHADSEAVYPAGVATPNTPLTPRESLARGCVLGAGWLLVVVLGLTLVLSRVMRSSRSARSVADAGRGSSADAGQAPR